MSDITIEVKGFEGIKAALDTLPHEVRTKMSVAAIRNGTKYLQTEIKNALPVSASFARGKGNTKQSKMSRRYGHLRDNIKIGRVKSKSMDQIMFNIYPGNAFWARFLEYGTKAHKITPKSGKKRAALFIAGKFIPSAEVSGISARPIWRNAFDSKVEQIFAMIRARFFTDLDKYATKNGLHGTAGMEAISNQIVPGL